MVREGTPCKRCERQNLSWSHSRNKREGYVENQVYRVFTFTERPPDLKVKSYLEEEES